jgi:exosortase
MSASSPRLSLPRWWLAAATAVLSLAALFGAVKYTYGHGHAPSTLGWMLWRLWEAYSDWSHGMFVPFISAFFVYWEREKLKKIPIAGDNRALAALVGVLLFYWAGYKADLQYVGFVAGQLFVATLVIWFLGWPFMKGVFFPWAFLIFMWPFIFLDNMIAFPLRMVMSEISYHFLNLIGLDCLKIGSAVVSAPDYAMGLPQGAKFAVDIADPCSGIRSLFALLMISALYGHLMLVKGWQKAVLFAAALPLAVLGNFFRILMLTFGTLLFGTPFAIGTLDQPSYYHTISGFVVFAVALAGMVGIAQALEADWPQIWKKGKEKWAKFSTQRMSPPSSTGPAKDSEQF